MIKTLSAWSSAWSIGWTRLEKRPFKAAFVLVAQFLVLTVIAMQIFPGGTLADSTTAGYSFWRNFFSELGMTVTASGAPNPVGAVIFFTALTGAGMGLILFFLAIPQLFQVQRRLRWLSGLGSFFGVVSGLCFIGVAYTPADLLVTPHYHFVIWAFRTFLLAVLCYLPAIWLRPGYPRVYAGVYLVFAALLATYLWLLTNGPGFETSQGVMVQAAGQKIIVYAAILSMGIQAWGAIRLLDHPLSDLVALADER